VREEEGLATKRRWSTAGLREYRGRFHEIILVDEAIREGGYPSSPAIALRIERSYKTVLRIIEFLRDSLGAPIEYDATRKGWHYTENNWSLPSVKITEGEVLGVALAQMALQAYKNTPLADYIRRVTEKLQAALPEEVQIDPSRFGSIFRFSFGPVTLFKPEHWELLVAAARQRHTVWMRYHAIWKDEVTEREVDPYLLRCFRGDWYLIGHDHKTGYVPIFDLARIRELRETKKTFFVRDDFDPDKYLSGTFQVSERSERHKVRIQFFGVAARFVDMKVWHPSQKLTHRKDGSVILEMTVADLDEIASWVLSFGPNAIALTPPTLREQIARSADETSSRYRAHDVTT